MAIGHQCSEDTMSTILVFVRGQYAFNTQQAPAQAWQEKLQPAFDACKREPDTTILCFLDEVNTASLEGRFSFQCLDTCHRFIGDILGDHRLAKLRSWKQLIRWMDSCRCCYDLVSVGTGSKFVLYSSLFSHLEFCILGWQAQVMLRLRESNALRWSLRPAQESVCSGGCKSLQRGGANPREFPASNACFRRDLTLQGDGAKVCQVRFVFVSFDDGQRLNKMI